jgi:hypothetical protein
MSAAVALGLGARNRLRSTSTGVVVPAERGHRWRAAPTSIS